jgi:hypothetical protein
MADHSTDESDWVLVGIVIAIILLLVGIACTFWWQAVTGSERVPIPGVEYSAISLEESGSKAAMTESIPSPVVATSTPQTTDLELYVEVTNGCGPHFEGECLRVRSGPGTEYGTVASLRSGMVLKVGEVVETPERIWYEIVFDEWLRYPERVSEKWYVAGEYVQEIRDVGPVVLTDTSPVTNKVITVDRSDQLLYAYDGDVLYMKESISTGLALSPTPRGTFTIFKKLPSRYMQGPLQYLAFSNYYDLPGVPWNLYFTEQGAVVHGTYWHDSFGQPYSSGCVNVDPALAKRLYDWAPIGTKVVVQD